MPSSRRAIVHLVLPCLVLPGLLLPVTGCLTDDAQPSSEERIDRLDSEHAVGTTAHDQLQRLRGELLDGVDEVQTERVWVDDLGMSHARVRQSVEGIPVFGAGAIVHADIDGDFAGMTDGLVRDLDVDLIPWLDEAWAIERSIEQSGGRARLSAEPTAQLMIVRHDERDHLAYRVQLRQMQPGQPPSLPVLFIDAHEGDEIWRYDALPHVALDSSYHVTWDMLGGTEFGAATIGDSSDDVLFETHKSVSSTIKFLVTQVGRDSYDNEGAVVDTFGHYGSGYTNAFWDPGAERLVLGDGDGVSFSHFGKRDIVAHELAHAVVNYEAALTNAGESGALGETTGDILAARVADYSNADWVFDIGEDCWLPADPSMALRYMGHPSDDGSSRDHYSDRYTGKADNGGVHFNSGIGNHFFYLLSEGGQHHDPAFRSGLVVDGIGIEAAFDIWYRALTVYMVPSTDFGDARQATEKAADDLFGENVRHQVETAWFEVGVGNAP